MLIGYSSMDPYSIIKIFECDFLIFIMLHILFQLISDAIRYGDCHKATMEMADYWLVEKQLVHKLFKVLVPRYENYNVSYIRMLSAPRPFLTGRIWKLFWNWRATLIHLYYRMAVLTVTWYIMFCWMKLRKLIGQKK